MRLPVRPQLQPGPAAALIAVPAAWGSMFPAIKALDLEAAPPPFALLNFAIHFVGAVALWGLYRQAAATEPPPPVAAPEYQPNRRTPAVDCTPVDGQWSMVDGRWSPPSRLAAEAVEAPARRRRRRGLKSSKLVPRQLVPRRVLPVSPAPATPSLLAVRLPPVPLPPPSPSAWPAPARAAAAAAQPPLSVAWDELRAAQSAVELGALLSLAQASMLLGLEGVSATTSAVLTESAVVIVPLLTPRGGRPLWQHWGPSAVALAGISLLVGGDNQLAGSALLAGGGGDNQLAFAGAAEALQHGRLPQGGGLLLQEAAMRPVALSLFSAACFAAHTVRTDAYADVAPLGQAAFQLVAAAALDALLLAGGMADTTEWLTAAPPSTLQHLLLAALWCGLVTCALTTWLQAYAQRSVPVSTAALAYSLEPCFAAALAAQHVTRPTRNAPRMPPGRARNIP